MCKITVNTLDKKSTISKNIYGHFSEHLGRCIYEGIYVGENSDIPNVNGMRSDVVNALKHIEVPVLRWPGGCFADEYHWKDGIGPKEGRKKMINTHWGGVVEDNSFGTHEFMELCSQLECEPYINGNLGSGTVQEMSEWVEYMTFDGLSPMSSLREENGAKRPWKLKYFGIGNENWGCGGNMRPQYYADEYRRYGVYVRSYDKENPIFKIACGPNTDDYNWTETMMTNAKCCMDALTLHYYTIPTGVWDKKGSATEFDVDMYYKTLKAAYKMEELVTRHLQIMDRHDPEHKVGLIVDEWGTWFDVEDGTNPGFLYQQNTMRDAIVASMTLDIFNSHSDRVIMANIAQVVNVLQSMILTDKEKMLLTPTYHVFDLYKDHHDATLLGTHIKAKNVGTDGNDIPQISATASEKDGHITLTLTNADAKNAADVEIEFVGSNINQVNAYILTGDMDAHNTFDNTENVSLQSFDSFSIKNQLLSAKLPACSVVKLTID